MNWTTTADNEYVQISSGLWLLPRSWDGNDPDETKDAPDQMARHQLWTLFREDTRVYLFI